MRYPFFASLTICLATSLPAQCWWEDGHRTTARLAAYYLTPMARTRIAAILSVPDNADSIADALAAASTWPDEIKKERPETAAWHYIDIALQDGKAQIPDRCPDQNCVAARIKMFEAQLIQDKDAPDQAVDRDALKFLVHFVGDIHQPLHASSDADLGGNCEALNPAYEQARNVHALWDGPMVSDINPDDRLLASELKKDLDGLNHRQRHKMEEGNAEDWAWQSHKIAETMIYKDFKIPLEPVLFPAGCKDAPQEIQDDKVTVASSYLTEMRPIVKLQLERAGLRLAKLLNAL